MSGEFIALIAPDVFDIDDSVVRIARTLDGRRCWERSPNEAKAAFIARVEAAATGAKLPAIWLDDLDVELAADAPVLAGSADQGALGAIAQGIDSLVSADLAVPAAGVARMSK